jgi:hypothetical protein
MSNKYSLKESIYKGHPVIIPLKEGKAILPIDQDFQFGIKKAIILMECIDIIRDFISFQDGVKLDESEKSIFVNDILIKYNFENSFIGKYGKKVNKPIVHFWWKTKYGGDGIRFGKEKAKAIYYLQAEIRKWIERNKR